MRRKRMSMADQQATFLNPATTKNYSEVATIDSLLLASKREKSKFHVADRMHKSNMRRS